MVPPGEYSVEMSRVDNGVWTKLEEKKSFRVVALNNANLPAADKDALFAFQQRVGKLDMLGDQVDEDIEKALEKLANRRQQVLNREKEDTQKLETIYNLRGEYLDLEKALSGRSVISDNAEFAPPSVRGRIRRVRGIFYNTTSAPTNTQKTSLDIAERQLNDISVKLRSLKERLNAID